MPASSMSVLDHGLAESSRLYYKLPNPDQCPLKNGQIIYESPLYETAHRRMPELKEETSGFAAEKKASQPYYKQLIQKAKNPPEIKSQKIWEIDS